MGKRKHFEQAYHLCDYTCYPLGANDSKRYLPLWKNGKVVKTGTYITWEAVVSHILHMKSRGTKPLAMAELKWDAEKSLQLVHEAAGRPVMPGLPYGDLDHFNINGQKMQEYLVACNNKRAPVTSMAIRTMGDTCTAHDFTLTPDGSGDYKACISAFFDGKAYNVIKPTRKVKGLPKFKELIIMTLVDNDMPLNKKAKQLFRMNLFGPVLLACNNKDENTLCEFNTEQYRAAFDSPLKSPSNKTDEGTDVGMQAEEFKDLATELRQAFDVLVETEATESENLSEQSKIKRTKKKNPPAIAKSPGITAAS